MKTRSTTKTIKTACGKTVSYLQTEGYPNKMHSTEGPAIIYAEEENKAPEYYLHGVKYSKAEWKDRTSQSKITVNTDLLFDSDYQTIY